MIDLHNHSFYSDGYYSPTEVVDNAARDGLKAIALCDHDCVWGLSEAKNRAKEVGVEVIPGVELTINVANDKDHAKEIHMLGLFVEPTVHLEDIHYRLQKEQNEFSYKMAKAMRDYRGIPIHVGNIRKHFRGAVTTGAFGVFMTQKGLVRQFSEYQQVCCELIAEGKLEPKPKLGISAQEAIDAIHEAGGLAILAHPFRMKLPEEVLLKRIKEYKDMGLDGLECYYKNYDEAEAEKIKKSLQIAYAMGLLITGGSDYHRDKSKGRFANGGEIPDKVLMELKEARKIKNAAFQKNLFANCGRVYE